MVIAAVTVLLLACCGQDTQAAPRIGDPGTFVVQVYKHLIDSQESDRPYRPPDDIYMPPLKKLLDKNFTSDGIGCLDFSFWVNAQDFTISDLHVSAREVGPDRRNVIASFRNIGHAEKM